MRDWPDTLLVEHDLDALCVTLGPSQRITAWGGLAGMFAATASGGTLAVSGQMFVGGLVSAVGVSIGAVARMRGWVREEAPLQLWVRGHGIELRRVFRGRLLHTERVPLEALADCTAVPNGLALRYRDGHERRLVTGFRSREEIAWVAEMLHERIEGAVPEAVDPRIARIREEQ